MIDLGRLFLTKAEENLSAAETDLTAGRPNSCASRCYYAAFQAAIHALSGAQIRPRGEQWSHAFVQAQFVGQLVNRRELYGVELRNTLRDNLIVRLRADYEEQFVSQEQATRALRRTRDLLTAVRKGS